jgi:hypothetical protein
MIHRLVAGPALASALVAALLLATLAPPSDAAQAQLWIDKSRLCLQKALPGTACFDPKQPWYLRVMVVNKFPEPYGEPPADAGPFRIAVAIMNGPTFTSGLAETMSFDVVDGLPFTSNIAVSMQLPEKVKPVDLGSKRAFWIAVDPENKVMKGGQDGVSPVFEWELKEGERVAIVPECPKTVPPPGSGSAPSADRDLKITDTAGVPGNKQKLKVEIKNVGTLRSVPATLTLNLFGTPTPGDPVRKTVGVADAKIPPLDPGAKAWVEISGPIAFVEPPADTSRAQAPRIRQSQPIAFRSIATRKAVLTRENVVRDASGVRVRQAPLTLVHVTGSSDYKALIPFALEVAGTNERLVFGMPAPTGGPIKIPGKK